MVETAELHEAQHRQRWWYSCRQRRSKLQEMLCFGFYFSWLPFELNLAHGILSIATLGHNSLLVCVASMLARPTSYQAKAPSNHMAIEL